LAEDNVLYLKPFIDFMPKNEYDWMLISGTGQKHPLWMIGILTGDFLKYEPKGLE